MINKQKKTYSRNKSKKAKVRKGKSTLLQNSINVSVVNQDDTLPDDLWKDSFDKLLGSRTPLRKNNVIKKIIRTSFNLDSSCCVSEDGDGIPVKSFKSISTPVVSRSKHKLACKISPIKENQRRFFVSTSMYDSKGNPKRFFEYSSEIGNSKIDSLNGHSLEMDKNSSDLVISELSSSKHHKSSKASDSGCSHEYNEVQGSREVFREISNSYYSNYVTDNSSFIDIQDEDDIPLSKYKKYLQNVPPMKRKTLQNEQLKLTNKQKTLKNGLLQLSSRSNVITSDIINNHNTKLVKDKSKSIPKGFNITKRKYPKRNKKLAKKNNFEQSRNSTYYELDKENIFCSETLSKNVTVRRAASRNLMKNRESNAVTILNDSSSISNNLTTTSRDNNASLITISLISPVEKPRHSRKTYKSRRKINHNNLNNTSDDEGCTSGSKETTSEIVLITSMENVEATEKEVLFGNSTQKHYGSTVLNDSKQVNPCVSCSGASLKNNSGRSFHLESPTPLESLELTNKRNTESSKSSPRISKSINIAANITTNIGLDSKPKDNNENNKENATGNVTIEETVHLSQVREDINITSGNLRDENSFSILCNTKQLNTINDLHKSSVKSRKVNDFRSGNKDLRSTLPSVRDLQFVTKRNKRPAKRVASVPDADSSTINRIQAEDNTKNIDMFAEIAKRGKMLQDEHLGSSMSSKIVRQSELISRQSMFLPNVTNSASVNDIITDNDTSRKTMETANITSKDRTTNEFITNKSALNVLKPADNALQTSSNTECNLSSLSPQSVERLQFVTRRSKRTTKNITGIQEESSSSYPSTEDGHSTSTTKEDLIDLTQDHITDYVNLGHFGQQNPSECKEVNDDINDIGLKIRKTSLKNKSNDDIHFILPFSTVSNTEFASRRNTRITKRVSLLPEDISSYYMSREISTNNKVSQPEIISAYYISSEDVPVALTSSKKCSPFEDAELITQITPARSKSITNNEDNILLNESSLVEETNLSNRETVHNINKTVLYEESSPRRSCNLALSTENDFSMNLIENINLETIKDHAKEDISSNSIRTQEDSQFVTRRSKRRLTRTLTKSSGTCTNELTTDVADLVQDNSATSTEDSINQRIFSDCNSPSTLTEKIADTQFVTRKSKRTTKSRSTVKVKSAVDCFDVENPSDILEDNSGLSTFDRDIENMQNVTRRSKRTSKNRSTNNNDKSSTDFLSVENNASDDILEVNTDKNASSTLHQPTDILDCVTRRSKRTLGRNSRKINEIANHILSVDSFIQENVTEKNSTNKSQESITEILHDSNEINSPSSRLPPPSSTQAVQLYAGTKQNTIRTPVRIYEILANNTIDLNSDANKSIVNEVIGLSPQIITKKKTKSRSKDYSNLEDSIDKEEFLNTIRSMAAKTNISSLNMSKSFRRIPRKSILVNSSDISLERSGRNDTTTLQRVYEEESGNEVNLLFEQDKSMPSIVLRPGKWRKSLVAFRKQNLSNYEPINNSKIQSSVNSTLMPISHDSQSEHLSFLSVTISNRSSRYARKTILESSALAKSIPENQSICLNDGKQLVDDVLLLEPTDDETPKLSTVSLLDNSAVQRNLFISLSGKRTTDYYHNKSTDREESNETSNERRRTYQHQLSIPLSYRQPSISRRRRTSIVEGSLPRIISGIPETDTCFSGFIHDPFETSIRSPLSPRDIVLRRCGQLEPLDFSIVYSEIELQQCRKIGEGVYGEVFMKKAPRGEAVVLKIIPIEGNIEVNGEQQKRFDEILSEIVIAMELSNLRNDREYATCGFVEVKAVRCVQGRYPEHLIDLWELYRDNSGTENDHPQIFPEDQLYIVLELANGGQDLEAFTFQNALQSYSAFLQTALTLAIAEFKFKFEHRDLHWGNILLAPTDEKEISFRINGRSVNIPTYGIKVTIIDYTLSRMVFDGCCLYNDLSNDNELFSATGDYQFDIYRLMKKELDNQWECFEPYTNILWLHYTIDKMISGARYRCSKSKKHRSAIDAMMQIRDELLDYKSASEYVECIN